MRPELYKISELIYKEFIGEINEQESVELHSWINADPKRETYYEKLFTTYSLEQIKQLDEIDTDEAWEKYNNKFRKTSLATKLFKYAAVFAAAILVGAGVFYFTDPKSEQLVAEQYNEILPGTSSAILIIDGKEQITLGENEPIEMSLNDGVNIKATSSEIAYNTKHESTGEQPIMHTLKIPRQGNFFITLSDGTNVWINAETTLKYMSRFDGDQRVVELDGEAYFEVSKDADKPFIVRTNGMDIRVLGTAFNVNSYNENPNIVTTLVEGRVRVYDPTINKPIEMTAGMQSVYDRKSHDIKSHAVDTDVFTAWKNGVFMYDNTPLEEIMMQMCRWYNINVTFEDNTSKNLRFSGEFKRFNNFEDIMKFMNLTTRVSVRSESNNIYIKSL